MSRVLVEQLFRAIANNPAVTKVTTEDRFVPYGLAEMLRTSTSVVDLSLRPFDFGNNIDNDAVVNAFAANMHLTKLELGDIVNATMASRILDALQTHVSLKELIVDFAVGRHEVLYDVVLQALNRLVLATTTVTVLRISNAIFMGQAPFSGMRQGIHTTLEEVHFEACKFQNDSAQHLKHFLHLAASVRQVFVDDSHFASEGAAVASILLVPPRPNSLPFEVMYAPGLYRRRGEGNLATLLDMLFSSPVYHNKLVLQLPRPLFAVEFLHDLCRRLPEIGSLRYLRLNVSLSPPILNALKNNFSLVTLETVDDATVTAEQQKKRMAYLERNRQLSTLMRNLPGNARIRPTLRVAAMPTGRMAHTNALRGLLELGDLK